MATHHKSANAAAAAKPAEFTKAQELHAYREMLLIRRFEEKAGQLYGMGHIGGFCHLYIGQEAVVVGMQMAIERGRPGHHQPIAITAICWPAAWTRGRHGRADRPAGRLFQGQGRLDAHVLRRRRASTAGTASSARRCRWAPGSRSPTSTGATAACASPISATARPIRARSTKPSTWPSCGRCRWSTSSRTTNTAWARASTASRPSTDLSQRGLSFNIPGEQVDGMDVRAVKAAGDRAVAQGARGQGAVHPGNADLPLSRPLHVRPGEIPHEGGSATRCARSTTPSSRCARACWRSGWADEDELKAIDKEIRAIVNEAAEFAQSDPEPDAAELYTDVVSGLTMTSASTGLAR